MRRPRLVLFSLILMIFLFGCATLQDKWEKATLQERTRITIYQFQAIVKDALVGGAIFVDNNPQYRAEWKAKGIPTAEYINGLLDQFIKDLDAGKPISFTTVTSAVSSKVAELVALVNAWGIKVSSYDIYIIMSRGGA